MKLAHKIDANGFMLDPVLVDNSFVNTTDTVVNVCPDGFYKPKWDGAQWIDAQPLSSTQILQDAQSTKINDLNNSCNTVLLGGFSSSALGTAHTYPSDLEAQRNLQGSIVDTLIDSAVTSINFKTMDAGYLSHTVAQIQQVGKDWKVFLQQYLNKYNTKKAQVNNCKTVSDVDSVVWNDTTPPSTPVGLTGTPGTAQATLNWTANSEIDVQIGGSYNVYKAGTKLANVTTTSYVASGLTSGTAVSFTVSAVDSDGNESPQSASVTVTPT